MCWSWNSSSGKRRPMVKRGMKVSRAKTERSCLRGSPLGSLQHAQLPQVTEFKYQGSALQCDRDMRAEVNKSTHCG